MLSRRSFFLSTSVAVLGAFVIPPGASAQQLPLPGVAVRPRDDWAQGLQPTGPLSQELPGDVRFILVHHTASTNAYAPTEVIAQIRGFYAMHTGPAKGWPDVAYNFFVDRYGIVWEGRAGSLQGPVKPDATGGSQGYAQLCCCIGDHQSEPPTPEAQRSMIALLAALADVYGIDTAPEATVTFVSRGSNRWPAGTSVTTATIAGHRDMSLTACPGDAVYPLVRNEFPAAVTEVRRQMSPSASASTPPRSAAAANSASGLPSASPAPSSAAGARTASRGASIGLTGVGLLAAAAAAGGAGAAVVLRGRRGAPVAAVEPVSQPQNDADLSAPPEN